MNALFCLLADGSAEVRFEWGRDLSTPAEWLVPLGVFLLLAWFVAGTYLLDCVELGRRMATLLIGLRLLALAGILLVYLQPQWRAQRDVVSNSRVLMLIDTSQSMGRQDVPASETGGKGGLQSRIDRVIGALQEGELLNQLRKTHDVVVYRFDQEDKPTAVAALSKFPPRPGQQVGGPSPRSADGPQLAAARGRMALAGGALLVALGLLAWYLIRPSLGGATGSGPLAGAGLALGAAAGIAIWAFFATPGLTVRGLLGLEAAANGQLLAAAPPREADQPIDWGDKLVAEGASTKLGQAVFQLVLDERATPVSAVVVISDGQRTDGLELEEAAKLARAEKLPIYTIGLGSLEQPRFVRFSDFAAPARAYAGDPFEVTGYVQSQGLAGRGAVVTLRQVANTESSQQAATDTGLLYEVETTLGADREDIVPVRFDVEGFENAGRYAFQLAVRVKGDRPAADQTVRRFYIDVVDRQTRVLLIAGGPSREYRFLRTLLRRDKYIDLEVLLQSMRRDTLDDSGYVAEFPSTRDQLAGYDAVVALDPDWLGVGAAAAAALEQWVSEDAGGLIVVPGNVHAGNIVGSWVYEPDYRPLHDLYPVTFPDRFAQLGERPPGSQTPWPLDFTRAGLAADFLRLDDNGAESQRRWSAFAGVYGGYPAKGLKYGATLYARFADPMAEPVGYDPIYFAGQFYGRGRVFYIGSGELWRLRQLDETYFEQFYTRLIRHVTMGRLHQGSPRGDALLLEKEQYSVGDTVPVVAHLKNAARQPLDVDQVTLFIFDLQGRGVPLKLKRDAARPGMFRGQFVVRQAEDYRLDLELPESDQEVLSKVIKVTASDLENRQPQQNDMALKQLAETTGGRYFSSIAAALGQTADRPLAPGLEDQTRVTPVAGDVDPVWKAAWARWMMFVICGLLSGEWLLRRLFKLA
ncbi:MAG: hypothetical protein GTO03_00990 [Planctomycetales bacterium]|nr:hypothetical protein [Planctomycetales bacterium]